MEFFRFLGDLRIPLGIRDYITRLFDRIRDNFLWKQRKKRPAFLVPYPPPYLSRPKKDGDKPGWVSPQYSSSRFLPLDMKSAMENRCVAVVPDLPEAEPYKILRTRILHRAMERHGNTLMVTSALPGEGKTLTSINLALTFARHFNQTALLVDCDLRKPNVYRYLGLPQEKGLVDYLLDGANISDLMIWPGIEKFTVLLSGRPFPESGELLGSPRMKELLADMRDRYPDRFVIFDVPPILSTADAIAFAPFVDHVVLVVQAGKTPLPDIKRALGMLPQEKILGIVLNRHESSQEKYYYHYADMPEERKMKGRIRPVQPKGGEKSPLLYLPKRRILPVQPTEEGNKAPTKPPKMQGKKDRKPYVLILLGSILSLALLAGFGYYVFWAISFSTASGWGAPRVVSPAEKIAIVPEKPSTEAPKPISPPPVKEEDGGSLAVSAVLPVSSGPPNSENTLPSPAPTAQEKVQKADGEEADKPKTIQETPKKGDPRRAEIAPKKDFFAIKIMALGDPKKTQEFLERQKQMGFDIHSRPVSTRDKRVLHQIFLGHFRNQEEALRFMKEQKIAQSYPGSAIMKLTP